LIQWTSNTKRGTRDQQTKLRGLAGEKGYEAVPALRSDGWHVLDRDGRPVAAPDGRSTFTIDQALAFLKRLAPPLAP
jgi:hypothetical protein